MTSTANVAAWTDENHEAWIGLSARFRGHVQHVSGRGDLVVKATPDLRPRHLRDASPRPMACFIPALAEVHITTTAVWPKMDVDPDTVDPSDPDDQAMHPHMAGAMCHEAAHSMHTHWAFPKNVDPQAAHWATLLEEPRIERALIASRPQDRVFLRACAITMVAGGALNVGGTSRGAAARSVVLFLGRAAAGVFNATETEQVRTEVAAILGEDLTDDLYAVVAGAVALEDGDSTGLLAAGAEFARLLAEDVPTDQPDQQGDHTEGDSADGGDPQQGGEQGGEQGAPYGSSAGSSAADGDTQDSASDGSAGSDDSANDDGNDAGSATPGDDTQARQMPCGSWTPGNLPEGIDPNTIPNHDHDTTGDPQGTDAGGPGPRLSTAVKEAAAQIEADATTSITARANPLPTPVDPHAAEKAAERADVAAAGEKVFGSGYARNSPVAIRITERTPSAPTREQARRLTSLLRRAQYRAVDVSRTPSMAPPGRLRMSEVVRRDAQKAAGVRITAQPWRQTRRRETENPPLTVGFSGDVSGSMGAWQAVTADLSWALAQAVTHLDGKVASVAWNTNAAPVLRPGRAPQMVPEAKCDGGSDGCAISLKALDSALDLSRGRGARVVVVVTDGQIPHYSDRINPEIERLTRNGVKVLWVTPKADHKVTNSATNVVLTNPAQFGDVIGKALADLLAKA